MADEGIVLDELPFKDERNGGVDHQDIFPASKQDVELYIRTYTTMLRSSGEVKVKALVQAHLNADFGPARQRSRHRARYVGLPLLRAAPARLHHAGAPRAPRPVG